MSRELHCEKKKVDEMSTTSCESILRGNTQSPWTKFMVCAHHSRQLCFAGSPFVAVSRRS